MIMNHLTQEFWQQMLTAAEHQVQRMTDNHKRIKSSGLFTDNEVLELEADIETCNDLVQFYRNKLNTP